MSRQKNETSLTQGEFRATASIAAIYMTRLLGLFMIYPVFAHYADGLTGATATTIGLALGAYGLTQGLLQIPFGLLSDRLGRRTLVIAGLALFCLGSVTAAMSHTITGVIVGRALQGAGAIGSVLLASVADVTRSETRTRAMAIVGVSIGFSFMVAVILGPLVAVFAGLSGIFWLTAGLALVGIVIASFVIPTRETHEAGIGIARASLRELITDPRLLELDFAIFTLHATMTALFLAVPMIVSRTLGLGGGSAWVLYLPVLVAAAGLMVPFVIIAEKHGRMNQIRLISVALIGLSELILLVLGNNAIGVVAALVIFFTAFTVLEALLPSALTKAAPASAKGTASGLYSSSQFIGIFVGGTIGGLAMDHGGAATVIGFVLALTLIWGASLALVSRRAASPQRS
ncbi:MFS transporter [Thioclava atlantica]|uniref:Major facilitator family transporter n=1 Tax=Thioclava atlantica TaxID=1317124 RepID=A0A085TSW0_9RHOB|nr:MFS transporter [Thioclava atlantica]KFE33807.1 major facilitator family transporter [Thioclava atlantica]